MIQIPSDKVAGTLRVPSAAPSCIPILRTARGACLLLFLLVAFCGCGSGAHQPTDEDHIVKAISGVADAAATPESFQAAFVEGASPADDARSSYSHYTYNASEVAITGETATAQVDVISPFTDESVAQAQWTCTRVAGKWQLQSAPLPADLPK